MSYVPSALTVCVSQTTVSEWLLAGQVIAPGVNPAGASLSVLWIWNTTAPTVTSWPSTCTLVRLQTYAHETLKRRLDDLTPLQGIYNYLRGPESAGPWIKTVREKKRKCNFGNLTHRCRSTTDDASVALLFLAAENNILSDFQSLGCFIWLNYPLQITIRCINSQGVWDKTVTVVSPVSSHRLVRNNVVALRNTTGKWFFLLSNFPIDYGARDYFTTHLSFKTFFRWASHRWWSRSDWGECFDSVEDFRLTMPWSYLSSDSHHAKRIVEFICWMVSLWINQSRKTSPGGKFINSFELVSLHGYTTLQYDSTIIADLLKRRMTGISFFGGFFSISWWPSLHVHQFKDQQCHKFIPSTY